MLEGDSADTYGRKFPLMSIGGRAEGLLCADPGARTPIGVTGIFGTDKVWVVCQIWSTICYYIFKQPGQLNTSIQSKCNVYN
jgi:hypothetical protein